MKNPESEYKKLYRDLQKASEKFKEELFLEKKLTLWRTVKKLRGNMREKLLEIYEVSK